MSNDIKYGSIDVDTFKYGSTQVDKIYYGSTQAWAATPPASYWNGASNNLGSLFNAQWGTDNSFSGRGTLITTGEHAGEVQSVAFSSTWLFDGSFNFGMFPAFNPPAPRTVYIATSVALDNTNSIYDYNSNIINGVLVGTISNGYNVYSYSVPADAVGLIQVSFITNVGSFYTRVYNSNPL